MKNIPKLFLTAMVILLLSASLPLLPKAASPKLNRQKAVLYVGQNASLKLKGASQKVVWKSTRPSVASVTQKGKVTAKKKGAATIVARSGQKSYRCTVTVKNPRLNKTKLKLKKGGSYQLKLTGTSAKSFQSSNPRVASVSSSGKVTARKPGTAVITCKGKNNRSYRCKVTVKKSSSGSQTLTESRVYSDIIALKSRYPEGKRWTNANSYAWKGGIFDVGFGCSGFAFRLSDAAFGNLPARKHKSFSKVRVGDIIRLDYDTHSVIVLEKQSDGVIVAEGNYNSSIYWGRKIPYSEIRRTGTYVLTRYPK